MTAFTIFMFGFLFGIVVGYPMGLFVKKLDDKEKNVKR